MKSYSIHAPSKVYESEWAPITEAIRWQVARALGLEALPLLVTEGLADQDFRSVQITSFGEKFPIAQSENQTAFARIRYADKKILAVPISQNTSLWAELLPFPFSKVVNHSLDPSFEIEFQPVDLAAQIQVALQKVNELERSMMETELNGIVLPGALLQNSQVIALQVVRKRRVRIGLLSGDALTWAHGYLMGVVAPDDALPRIRMFELSQENPVHSPALPTAAPTIEPEQKSVEGP